jgi:hypothetical protein
MYSIRRCSPCYRLLQQWWLFKLCLLNTYSGKGRKGKINRTVGLSLLVKLANYLTVFFSHSKIINSRQTNRPYVLAWQAFTGTGHTYSHGRPSRARWHSPGHVQFCISDFTVRASVSLWERGAWCVLALPIDLLAASGFGLQSTNIVVLYYAVASGWFAWLKISG